MLAVHYSLGLEQVLTEGFELDVLAFYKDMYDLVLSVDDNSVKMPSMMVHNAH